MLTPGHLLGDATPMVADEMRNHNPASWGQVHRSAPGTMGRRGGTSKNMFRVIRCCKQLSSKATPPTGRRASQRRGLEAGAVKGVAKMQPPGTPSPTGP